MQSNLNLINGQFITLDDNIDSITIEGGKIKDFNRPNSTFKTIDLKNNSIIPGFIDSHFQEVLKIAVFGFNQFNEVIGKIC